MAAQDTGHLLPRQPEEPRTQRLGMGQHFLWLLAGVAGTAVVAVMWFSYTKQAPQVLIQEAKPPTRAELMATPTANDGVLPFQQQYLGHSREVVAPLPPVKAPAPPKPEPLEEPIVTPLPESITKAALNNPFSQEPATKTETKKDEGKKEEQGSKNVIQNTPPQKKQPKRWLNDATIPIAKPVFPLEKLVKGTKEEREKDVTSSLIKPASWAQLEHPTYALYRTQTIHGILMHNIVSDIPGQVQILVTRPVVAEQDPSMTVIEQFSRLLGTQTGKISYGASRLDVTIDQLQTPDKVIIDLGKSKLADKSGAVGGEADVDNKIPRVLLGAGISAVLSIGARSAGGSPSGFQPSLGQDFARDASESINTSGQRIVEQQINISPTLTLKAGEPVTIQILENYSFQKPPVTITK